MLLTACGKYSIADVHVLRVNLGRILRGSASIHTKFVADAFFLATCQKRKEKKTREEFTPLGISLMRSQVLYRATCYHCLANIPTLSYDRNDKNQLSMHMWHICSRMLALSYISPAT